MIRHFRQILLLLGLALPCIALAADPAPRNAGPYVPSPQTVVADMLRIAGVGPKDFVIDLGSGDGRIVLTAAQVFGASGFGVEIKDDLVKLSNEAAQKAGLADRVKFIKADLFKADFSKATVLTMYLLPDTVNALRDKLFNDLRPGTRIISHDYSLGGWKYKEMRHMDLEDKVQISGVTTTLIFLYLVPEKIAGAWQAKLPPAIGREAASFNFVQDITTINGTASVGEARVRLSNGLIQGDQLSFVVDLGGKSHSFEGRVKDGTVTGTVKVRGEVAPWSATRAK
ncbi:MAG TPA: methyltransferase domain-containing protein [Burkholderiales bacterium]